MVIRATVVRATFCQNMMARMPRKLMSSGRICCENPLTTPVTSSDWSICLAIAALGRRLKNDSGSRRTWRECILNEPLFDQARKPRIGVLGESPEERGDEIDDKQPDDGPQQGIEGLAGRPGRDMTLGMRFGVFDGWRMSDGGAIRQLRIGSSIGCCRLRRDRPRGLSAR